MLKFPKELNIVGKVLVDPDDVKPYTDNFAEFNNKRIVSQFRNEIYNLLVGRKDENDFFDLDTFAKQNGCNVYNDNMKRLFESVIEELHELGWKTKISFGDTGLFIYSTEKEPRSCW